jgi:gas vesicle protein
MDRTGNFVWFLAGAAVGAGIALLYAPKSGRDTRRLIGRKARHSRDAVVDIGRDLWDKGRDLYEKGRQVADDAAEMFERGRRLVES